MWIQSGSYGYFVIGEVEELVVVSDRHKNIEEFVSIVFPHIVHKVCIHHININIKDYICHSNVVSFSSVGIPLRINYMLCKMLMLLENCPQILIVNIKFNCYFV